MAKKNWDQHIKDRSKIVYKKYLYVLRPLFMIIYLKSDEYEKNKSSQPIIFDFYELFDIVKKCDHLKISEKIINQIDLIIRYKKTDKHYAGEPLNDLDEWIVMFFKNEEPEAKLTDGKQLVLQALQSTRDRTIKEMKKINNIITKNDTISRNDLLSLFGCLLQYVWLVQNPDKHSGDQPTNISGLVDQVVIGDDLKQWIRSVVQTKHETVDPSIQKQRIELVDQFLTNLIDFLRYAGHLDESEQIVEILREMHRTGKMPRDDLVDYLVRGHMTAMWFLKSDQNIRNIPKDIFSDDCSNAINKQTILAVKEMVSRLRPQYTIRCEKKYYEMMQHLIDSNEEYCKEMTSKYNKKKEIDKMMIFKGSVQQVDPMMFIDLLERFS